MKNKPLVVVLLVVVALVWGNVIYKFIKNMGVKEEGWGLASNMNESLIIPSTDDLDFQLMLDYPDPFLVSRKKTSKSSDKEEIAFERAFEDEINSTSARVQQKNDRGGNRGSTNTNSTAPTQRIRPYQWPNISYHGVVKRQGTTNSGLLMIKYNNELINVRQGEYFFGDFKITKSWRDSVQIINERMETKIFYR